MGNVFNCHREDAFDEPKKENLVANLREFSAGQSTSSITVASVAKVGEQNDASARQSVGSAKSSAVFSWSRMQDIYLENTKNSESNGVLSKEIISSVLGLLNNLLDDNEVKTGRRLYVRCK